ncbi:TPA: hypothetical protein SUB30_005321 [Bacillus pseudomycoides]|nr:hypothetical protein [Bacillus pseudomycoides]
MKQIKVFLFFVLLFEFLHPSYQVAANINNEEADYTFLIYMIGSDMESDFHMASDDIQEMINIDSSSNINVILQTGGAKKWTNPNISNDTNQRWKVEKNNLKLIKNIGMKNMDNPASLADFIKWGMKEYPAKRYVLLFWGHGLGAVDGYGGDENYGNKKMKVDELESGVQQGMKGTQKKFDLIGFDNCKMANLETAYALRKYGQYMLASVDYTNRNGWDYEVMLKAVHDNPSIKPWTLGKEIAKGYLAQSKKNGETEDLQQSLIKLNGVDKVVKSLNEFSVKMNHALEYPYSKPFLHYARLNAEDYADESDMVDLVDLSQKIGTHIGARKEARDIKKAVENAVVYNMKTPEHPIGKGISIYFPGRDKESRFNEKASIYRNLEFSKYYKDFIERYSK